MHFYSLSIILAPKQSITKLIQVLLYPDKYEIVVESRMNRIESKIKHALENKGIKCQSIFTMKDLDDTRVLLAFKSQDNQKLSIKKIENALSTLNEGEIVVSKEFQRLSSAFLHLEVTLGARTEAKITPGAS